MDLSVSEEQQQLVDAVATLLGDASSPGRVRAAEPLGFDPELWHHTVEMGLHSAALAGERGGGVSLVDVALVVEQFGRHLAPAPLIEAVVALRALERSGDVAVLDRALDDREPTTLALHEARDGCARLVPAGAVAAWVVALEGDELVAATSKPSGRAMPNLARTPLAGRSIAADATTERLVVARDSLAVVTHSAAVDEWKALTANALAGLASAALELAVDYAKEREQFGVPIGSFQALAHQLADTATDVDGARLLALEAAWAVDESPSDVPRLASMAFSWCAEVAQAAAARCVHVHGGMGFSTECDAQLYFRRASGWPQLWSGVGHEYQRLAAVLYGPVEEA